MDLSEAAQHLWDNDVNRCILGDDIRINVQKGKKPYWKEDNAEEPLFEYVTADLKERSTYMTFRALLDNYDESVGTPETLSNTERDEVTNFLSAICETSVMKYCHEYCIKNSNNKFNNIPEDPIEFQQLLHSIWFDMYHRSRGGREDSSGFEHVFVGEIKDNEISGFHNWIQYYVEEKKGTIDYRGYIKPKGSNDDGELENDDYILTIQFRWNGIEKFVGSSFIGTSPEFEFALYTLCFICGEEDNHLSLNTGNDTYKLNIKCYTMDGNKIGTTFPEVVQHYDE